MACWKLSLLTSCLALGVYINTFNADFAYDDNRAILTNGDLLPTTSWAQLFYNDFWGTSLRHSGSHKSYRPLCVLTFRFNYYFGALNPIGYHVFNVLLHAIVTGLFTFFCTEVTKDILIGLVAGLSFAVHPIHTEAVAGIVGRADSGAALFFLLSMVFYRKVYTLDNHGNGRTNWTNLIFCVVLGGLSMFTKETGVTVILVCAAFDVVLISNFKIFNIRTSIERAWRMGTICRVLFLGFSGILLLYVRLLIMGNSTPDFSPSDNPAAHDKDFLTRLLTFFYLPAFNFLLLLYPSQLSFDWSMDSVPLLHDILDVRNVVTMSFYLIYGLFVLHCQHDTCGGVKVLDNDSYFVQTCSDSSLLPRISSRNTKTIINGKDIKNNNEPEKGSSPTLLGAAKFKKSIVTNGVSSNSPDFGSCVIFGLAWMTLSFLPATNLFFYVGFVVAERILYIPSMGYSLLFALGFVTLYRLTSMAEVKHLLLGFLICLVTLFSVRTILRNYDWQNEESLYRAGIQVNPAKAWGNLANILAQKEKITDAENAYKAALRFRPNMADTHYNLGILLQNRKKFDEASQCYLNAIRYRPKLAAAHLNLGILYNEIGNKEKALEILRNAQNISDHGLKDPKTHLSSLTSIRYNIGKILFELERYKGALVSFKYALEVKPKDYAAHSLYNMLGQTLTWLGSNTEAESWYKKALDEKADHTPAHLTLATHYRKMGKVQEADHWFQKALKIKPVTQDTYIHYAQFLIANGKRKQGFDLLIHGVKESPKDAEFAYFAGGIFREQNDIELAEYCYRKAAELNPDELPYLINLGALLHLKKDYEQAERIYELILRKKPNEELTLANLRKLQSAKQKLNRTNKL